MERWVTTTTRLPLLASQPVGHAPWEGGPAVRGRREEWYPAALSVCNRCMQPFAADDRVILAVQFRDLGKRVLMGRELLIHDACLPLRNGLRVVGRGRFGEIVDGMRHRYPVTGASVRPERGARP